MEAGKALTSIFMFATFILFPYTSSFAEIKKGVASKLSVDAGLEQLNYKEHEPDTGFDSNAKVINWIIGIEGLKRWEYIFVGIKAVIPVIEGEDKEEWRRFGSLYQTNTLKYKWMRADGYLGYPLAYWLNPYGGLRWSEAIQNRYDFVVRGISAAGTAKEEIRSWSLLVGIRGNGEITSRWEWYYWLEYFYPIDIEVTNSMLPGYKSTDKEGYALELRVGAGYYFTDALFFGIQIYGGRMHWEGSDWNPHGASLVKWPENDTDYLGGILKASWRF